MRLSTFSLSIDSFSAVFSSPTLIAFSSFRYSNSLSTSSRSISCLTLFCVLFLPGGVTSSASFAIEYGVFSSLSLNSDNCRAMASLLAPKFSRAAKSPASSAFEIWVNRSSSRALSSSYTVRRYFGVADSLAGDGAAGAGASAFGATASAFGVNGLASPGCTYGARHGIFAGSIAGVIFGATGPSTGRFSVSGSGAGAAGWRKRAAFSAASLRATSPGRSFPKRFAKSTRVSDGTSGDDTNGVSRNAATLTAASAGDTFGKASEGTVPTSTPRSSSTTALTSAGSGAVELCGPPSYLLANAPLTPAALPLAMTLAASASAAA